MFCKRPNSLSKKFISKIFHLYLHSYMYVVTNTCKKKNYSSHTFFVSFFHVSPSYALFSTRLASAYTSTFYYKRFQKVTQFGFFSDVDSKDWVKKECGLAFFCMFSLSLLLKSRT